jgi:hypothetical protein
MLELGTHHATVETECDLEATMDTLVADPVYEFWPAGRRMTGRDAVRRYYEHLMSDFIPKQLGFELIEEWLSEASLCQEYAIEVDGPDGPETHHVIGILFASAERDGLLGGERIWGSEPFLRRMVGPVWDDLESIHS